ncbi:MAG: hypothetical protein EBZ77_16840, partial [Chitinophagia bacterium]|nr:hypothetical protein [Chitinophagia bacterium]
MQSVTATAGTVVAFTRYAATEVRLTQFLAPQTATRSLEFTLRCAAADGVMFDVKTQAVEVVVSPTTATIAAVHSGSGVVFVADTATPVSIGLDVAGTIADVVATGVQFSYVAALGQWTATYTATQIVETMVTVVMDATRARLRRLVAQSAIYRFPASSGVTLAAATSSVTVSTATTLTIGIEGTVPAGLTHTFTPSSGVTVQATATQLVYTATTTGPQFGGTVRLSVAGVYSVYDVVASGTTIYTFPTSVSSTVSVASSSEADDAAIDTIAVGGVYGTGLGSIASVELVLSAEATVTSVRVKDETGSTYGSAVAFSTSGAKIAVTSYTAGTTVATGAVQFEATLTAPDGATKPVSFGSLVTKRDAVTATLGVVAAGVTLVAGSETTVAVTFAD